MAIAELTIEKKEKAMDPDKILLNCAEVAKYTGFTESRIRYETFLKRIPHIKIGRSVRFSKPAIDAWLESHSKKPS
jgi:excisionase family DNA binding protein